VLDREVNPHSAVPTDWKDHAASVAFGEPLPTSMTDGAEPRWTPWDGTADTPLDRAIQETRRAVYPLYDLDPEDPRIN
jgi:acetoin utilization protein AcuC